MLLKTKLLAAIIVAVVVVAAAGVGIWMLVGQVNIAIAENEVPSTGDWSPHIHIFFQMGDGSCVAFFELPESPDMNLDPGTPDWVQHLALAVDDMDTLLDYKTRLEADGIDVIGPTDHQICQSIYFFDPNGHRLELVANTQTQEQIDELKRVAPAMLEEWSQTKKAPRHAAWLHELEFRG